MAISLIVTTLLAVLALTVIAKVTTAEFYNAGNYAFATQLYGTATWPTAGAGSPFPIWTYPGLLAASLTTSSFLQLVLIILLSLWFWGWCGTVFLSSTRVLFAAAFDRVLPEWAAAVSRGGVPINALIGMVVPAMIVSVLYCYNVWSFQTITLDATLVIAITFFGSTLVAVLLPWRQKRIYDQSPIARYTVAGVPLITVAGVIFLLFLGWNLYQWFSNAVYGVNNHTSLWFILALYVIALVIYGASRVLNSQRGVNLTAIHREIPVE
jgi:amino acid transporter